MKASIEVKEELPDQPDTPEEEVEEEEDPASETDYLQPLLILLEIGYTGIELASNQDEMMLSDAQRQRIRRMKRKGLRIIEHVIDQAYDYLFSEEKEQDQDS
jgi:hypothetical protein